MTPIEFGNRCLIISDLHLASHTNLSNALFDYFLREIIPGASSLIILGDFFQYWLGDDLMTSHQESIFKQLQALQKKGCSVYFIVGNRDFLLSQKRLAEYHIQLLEDPSLLMIQNQRVLVCHGDHLCTLDRAYQRYKRVARHPFVKWLFLHLPKPWRASLAESIHQKNPHQAQAARADYILADATENGIIADLQTYHPDVLIHGHTHRLGEHLHQGVRRLVLGDWHHQGSYIEITPQGCTLQRFTIEPN